MLKNQELKITSPFDYYCLTAPDEWSVVNSINLLHAIKSDVSVEEPSNLPAMSLRLSTGVIGELDCPAGNFGPKSANEVIIGLGQAGIKGLLELGGLPCVVCHPELRLMQMGNEVIDILANNANGLEHASDLNWLSSHYDARRLDWQRLGRLGVSPGRFYTRPNLQESEVKAIRQTFEEANLSIPSIGFYDATNEDSFTNY